MFSLKKWVRSLNVGSDRNRSPIRKQLSRLGLEGLEARWVPTHAVDFINQEFTSAYSFSGGTSVYRLSETIGGPEAEGANDVDMWKVFLPAGTTLTMNINARDIGSNLDSIVRVFNSSGTQLAVNDDASNPGSFNGLDSFLTFVAPSTGEYFVGVSAYSNFNYNALNGTGSVDGFSTGAFDLYIYNRGSNAVPTAEAGGVYNVGEGGAVGLSGTGSGDADGDSLTYQWDVDNGSFETGGVFPTFSAAGIDGFTSRTVQLRVIDHYGAISFPDTATVNIQNVPPTIMAVSVPGSANEGAAVGMSAAATDPAGAADPLTYTWSFGDGSPNATGPSVSHTYADNGTYTVTLTVTDGDAGVAQTTRTIAVANVAPTGSILNAPATSPEGTAINLNSSVTDPGADTFTYAWEVTKDGVVYATGASPGISFTPDDNGNYRVSLLITDDDGGSTRTFLGSYRVNAGPDWPTNPPVYSGRDAAALIFGGSFADYEVSTSPTVITGTAWYDGWGEHSGMEFHQDYKLDDGVPGYNNPGGGGTARSAYVRDGLGNQFVNYVWQQGVDAREITVYNVAPALAVNSAAVAVDEGTTATNGGTWADVAADTVTLAASVGAVVKNADGTWTWSYNATDDLPATTVTITATDEDGGETARTFTLTVNNANPTVSQTVAGATRQEGSPVTITVDATDPAGAADPLAYEFDFDNNGTYEVGPQASPSASHTFGDNGTYTVNVRVTDYDGGVGTGSSTFSVANVDPVIASVTAPTESDEAEGVAFSAVATDVPADVLTYTWNFGDGSPAATGAGVGHTYADDGTYTVTLTVTDEDGGTATTTRSVTVNNVAPTADAGADQAVDEGTGVSLAGSFTDPGTVDTHTQAWSVAASNGQVIASGSGSTYSFVPNDNGAYTVTYTVTDDDSGVGTDTALVTVNNVAPTVSVITAPVDPVAVDTPITSFSAAIADVGVVDTHTASWVWGDGSTSAGTVTEVGGSGSVNDTHTYAAAGVYTVKLTVTDKDGGVVSTSYQYVVVYDPAAGFVTGGGWIDSPAGAYAAAPTLTGKANFGFVSKYQKGATTPTGQTQFQFQVGNLNFHSTSYDWLVVAGARAQYKGSGTINGSGNYKFLLTAIDGQLPGGGGDDKFRIKILDAAGAVVYDNQMGLADDGNPTMLLGGGSIKIHS